MTALRRSPGLLSIGSQCSGLPSTKWCVPQEIPSQRWLIFCGGKLCPEVSGYSVGGEMDLL